jgi:hypothetical protein
MVGPELPELGPLLRTPTSGLSFLHGSVGLRFGVFRTAPMTKLPVIFCLMCFFFSPAIAGTQLAPGLNAHTYDLSVAEIDAIKAAVTSILKNPESARFSTIVASENEKTGQITACGYVNAKNSSGAYAGKQPFKGMLKGKRFVITKPLGSSMTIIRCIYNGVPLLF